MNPTLAAAAAAPPSPAGGATAAMAPRTRMLLEAPILPTLLKLAAPNMVVMVAQASAGLIETWFIGKLGTDALAGMALVFPLVMLMQMLSAGAIGGGIASAIARALGAGRRDDANALIFHSLAISVGLGVLYTLVMLSGGRWLYERMGGVGASLDAALVYSHWVFAGAVLVWIFNALSSIIRGTGNMGVPAWVTLIGTLGLIPLSPLLIFGIGGWQGLGIAGGALALLAFYAGGTVALTAYLLSARSVLRPRWGAMRWRWSFFTDILRVGLFGAISTVATNLVIAGTTAFAGHFGPAAVAGYGTAVRLEYLLVPLVFGLGAPLIAMVGTSIGAGLHQRALRAAGVGAAVAFTVTETIGLAAALAPHAWMSLFGSDAAMLEAGVGYLRIVGPFYGFFGLALVLYFASQGAGRLLWPVIGNGVRLVVSLLGGWLALQAGLGLTWVFIAQAVALVAYALINGGAIWLGAWSAASPARKAG